jgi:hypothetical protein
MDSKGLHPASAVRPRFVSVFTSVVALSVIRCSSAERLNRRLLDSYSYSRNFAASPLRAANRNASVTGDPVLSAFDGQEFEFHGQADHFYNLVSEKNAFQVPFKMPGHIMQFSNVLLCGLCSLEAIRVQ